VGFNGEEKGDSPSDIAFSVAPNMQEESKGDNKKNQDKTKVEMKDKSKKQRTDKNQKILGQEESSDRG
jgi:hypothetical protein